MMNEVVIVCVCVCVCVCARVHASVCITLPLYEGCDGDFSLCLSLKFVIRNLVWLLEKYLNTINALLSISDIYWERLQSYRANNYGILALLVSNITRSFPQALIFCPIWHHFILYCYVGTVRQWMSAIFIWLTPKKSERQKQIDVVHQVYLQSPNIHFCKWYALLHSDC